MQLVERHIIPRGHAYYKECDRVSFLAKNMYNVGNYIVRQHFFEESKKPIEERVKIYLNYYDLNKMMITSQNVDYVALPRKVSNQVLKALDKSWVSFFESIKDYAKHPDKYKGQPKLPKYKDPKKGRFVVPYEKGSISIPSLKQGILKLSGTNIKIKVHKATWDTVQSARIVPGHGQYTIEIIYKEDENDYGLDTSRVIGIDLGVNNLASVACSDGDTFIIKGKPLKSINQYYNKKRAELQSKLKSNKKTSNRLNKLTNKRNNKVNDYLHKASKKIIDYCLTNNVGRIVVGHNVGWKTEVNIGSKNNQNFVCIPHSKLIAMLKYKAEFNTIQFETTEESYTSKCSFVDNEPMKHHDSYMGRRTKRGAFISKNNVILNADINGAFNMIRKVVPMFSAHALYYGIEGVAVHPRMIAIS